MKTNKFLKVMGLVGIISLGSFFYLADVQRKVANGTVSYNELIWLQHSKLIGNTRSLLTAYKQGSPAWLNVAKLTATDNAIAAFELSKYYRTNNKARAANVWLQQALRLDHFDAKILRAKQYLASGAFVQARQLLQPLQTEPSALSLLVEVEMAIGNYQFLAKHQAVIANTVEQEFYQELQKYRVFNRSPTQEPLLRDTFSDNETNPLYFAPTFQQSAQLTKTCLASVQLFATRLTDLRQTQRLVTEFSSHPLQQYICLLAPQYISLSALNCRHQRDEKIQCNAAVWQHYQHIKARYLGVILPNGGANVDSGIMYLDRQDTLEVWGHELSHLLGFVDEYPLPVNHQACADVQQAPFSHNIAVLPEIFTGDRSTVRQQVLAQTPWAKFIKDATPILTASVLKEGMQEWLVGTPNSYANEIGIFTAKTCTNSTTVAFKPLNFRTQLQYFELGFPKQYIKMLQAQPKHYLMPSFHFNVSKSLANLGEIDNARAVLKRTRFRELKH